LCHLRPCRYSSPRGDRRTRKFPRPPYPAAGTRLSDVLPSEESRYGMQDHTDFLRTQLPDLLQH
jgi:hypothetical protein